MKQLILILILVCFSFTLCADEAFSLFAAGKYQEAEKELVSKVKEDSVMPLMLYNLGVIAEKQQKTGQAVYYYLQALQAAPDFSDARNNLDMIVKDNNLKIPQILDSSGQSISFVIILFLVFLYLFIFLLILYLFRQTWKIRLALIPVFMLFALFTVLFFVQYKEISADHFGVAVGSVPLYSGPDEILTKIGSVREGEVLEIRSISDNWIKAKSFQDNIEGWIPGQYVRQIARRIY